MNKRLKNEIQGASRLLFVYVGIPVILTILAASIGAPFN